MHRTDMHHNDWSEASLYHHRLQRRDAGIIRQANVRPIRWPHPDQALVAAEGCRSTCGPYRLEVRQFEDARWAGRFDGQWQIVSRQIGRPVRQDGP